MIHFRKRQLVNLRKILQWRRSKKWNKSERNVGRKWKKPSGKEMKRS